MGEAQLMGSFTGEEQLKKHSEMLRARDEAYGVDMGKKAEGRAYIEKPEVHEGECADDRNHTVRGLIVSRCGCVLEENSRW